MKLVYGCIIAALLVMIAEPAAATNLHQKYGSGWSCKMMNIGPRYDACRSCESANMDYDDSGRCIARPGSAGNTRSEPPSPPVVSHPAPRAPISRESSGPGPYGAFAIAEREKPHVGVTTGFASRETKAEAMDAAMSNCQKQGFPGCQVISTWNSGCGFLVIGSKDRGVMWIVRKSREAALSTCKADGYTCKPPIGTCFGE